MATLSGGLIDPSKPAEYPILLGDKLAGRDSAKDIRFLNVNYNHKTKSASPQQSTVITQGQSDDLYNLTIQDKAGDAQQTSLTYKYRGSVDPNSPASESEHGSLFLVFDPKRKAFILEPVSTRLNFNLRSAPGKSGRQVSEQHSQLSTLLDEARSSNSKSDEGRTADDEPGPADKSNPFDYRHFLPKESPQTDKAAIKSPSIANLELDNAATKPERPHQTPSTATAGTKQKTKAVPKPKAQANPLRQQKQTTKPSPGNKPDSAPVDSSPSEEEPKQKPEPPAASPNSGNIIVDGDLIIDMGSPPPQRPAFKINPRHFSSNNTSANEAGYGSDDEEELEDPRLPSPALRRPVSREREKAEETDEDDEDEVEDEEDAEPQEELGAETKAGGGAELDDDDLAAEMEAAFEQGAREEQEQQQIRNQQLQQMQQQQRHIVSDDESEVSEEE